MASRDFAFFWGNVVVQVNVFTITHESILKLNFILLSYI